MYEIDPGRSLIKLRSLDKSMPLTISWLEMWKVVSAVINQSNRGYLPIMGRGQDVANSGDSRSSMELGIDLLVWHRNMIRNSIEALLDGGVDLGLDDVTPGDVRLFKLEPLTALSMASPDSLLHTAAKHNWNVTLFLSRVCWRNMVDTRYLGTLVARLFVGSFSSTKVEQNFRLEYDRGSLVHYGFMSVKKRDWASILHAQNGLTVFNSTTIYSFLLSKLIGLWDCKLPPRLRRHVKVERS
jgi:hypothetical protein